MLRQLCLGCLLMLTAGGLLTAQTLPTPTDSIPALHGRVQTTEGTPVELANVVLLCAADSTFLQGTCSRADGSFALSPASPGHYLLQVSCVGYETLLQPTDGQGSITCTLQAVSMALDETVITARRPQYRLKQGGTLETDVRHSLLARLETAADVLARLPGMRGSAEEGFTVFGKGTPLIYIDNRQLQDVTELLRLNAADIDRVELITNPGPEYDAEVKAVIRIRTIRGRDDGWGGNVRLALTQGRRPGHAEQVGVNYQRGGLSMQASAYGNLNQERMGRDARYLISSADGEGQTRDVRDAFDRRLKGHSLGASASVDYALNPRHSVGASYQFFRTPDLRMAFDSWYATMQPDGTPEERTDKTSHNLMQNTSHQLNAYYQGDAKDWHIDLTADALIGSSLDTQQAHEMHDDGTEQEIDSRNRSRNRLFAAKLILSHPLGRGTVKLGADHTFIRRRDRFLNPQDLLPTTDSRIDERKTAAFAQYVLNVGKVSASAGLRYEHARSRYYEQGILVPEQSRTYDDWLPTLSADFPLGKVQASLSYTAKTTRPSFMQLRSSMNYNNRYIYEGGNPLLRPETVHNVQLLLLWRWLQGSVSYTRRRNAIEFQSRDYAGDADVVLFSSANYPRLETLDVSLFASPKIGCWEPTWGALFTQPFFSVMNEGVRRRLNRASVYVVWRNNWTLPGGWMLSLDASAQTRGDQGTARIDRLWGMDVAVRRSWLDGRLTLSLQGQDLWNTRRVNTQLFGSRLTYEKTVRPDSRRFLLTVSYRFRAKAKAYQGKPAAADDLQRL